MFEIELTADTAEIELTSQSSGVVYWGTICGTLSDQTDLQTALNAKANIATTLAGYGITDAKIEGGVITLGSNTITPITDISGKADITYVDTQLATKANIATTYTKTEVDTALATKQNTLTAGSNVQINGNVISATDTTYTAGTGISIVDNVISNTQTSAEWGNITGTLSAQTDLMTALNGKQATLIAGTNITIVDNVISATGGGGGNYISNSGEPFTSLAQLEAYAGTVTNNDYAFVAGTDEVSNAYLDRYKATVAGTTINWSKEYRLHNVSFTSSQWETINSGLNALLVASYNTHVANTNIHVTASDKSNWNGKATGSIAGGVITINGNSITPLTQHQDISGKVDKTTTVNGHALSGNVTVTKGDVGLGNCDNTSDLNKPISNATQTALNGKVAIVQGAVNKDRLLIVNTSGNISVFEHDGSAGFHNSIYRGKYLGDAITTAQNTAIANRTYDDMYIGDYWTIGGVNYRIAAFEYYYNCGDTNFAVGHIIVVPDSSLTYAVMNDTNTTAGGYANSKMRGNSGGLATARATIASAFGSRVASHRIIMTNASGSNGPTGWGWMDSTGVELMNEVQVYGAPAFGGGCAGHYFDIGTQKQQLPLFALSPKHINTRDNYWLQDISAYWPAGGFAFVDAGGFAYGRNASNSFGVRPAITLKAV